MIARFLLDCGLGRFSFDYLGPPWAFIAIVSLLIVILVPFRSLLRRASRVASCVNTMARRVR